MYTVSMWISCKLAKEDLLMYLSNLNIDKNPFV